MNRIQILNRDFYALLHNRNESITFLNRYMLNDKTAVIGNQFRRNKILNSKPVRLLYCLGHKTVALAAIYTAFWRLPTEYGTIKTPTEYGTIKTDNVIHGLALKRNQFVHFEKKKNVHEFQRLKNNFSCIFEVQKK